MIITQKILLISIVSITSFVMAPSLFSEDAKDMLKTYKISCPKTTYPAVVNCADKASALCYGQYEKAQQKLDVAFSNHAPVCEVNEIDTKGIKYISIANEELKKLGLASVHPEKIRWRTAECAFISDKVRIIIAQQSDKNVKAKLWELVLKGDETEAGNFILGKRPGDLCNFAGRGKDENNKAIPGFLDPHQAGGYSSIWNGISEGVLRKVSEAKFNLTDTPWGNLKDRLAETGDKVLAYYENNQPWGVGVSPNHPQLKILGLKKGEGMNKQGRILMMVREPMRIRVHNGPDDISLNWSMDWNSLDGGPKTPDKDKAIEAKAFYRTLFNQQLILNKNRKDFKLIAPGNITIKLNRAIESATQGNNACLVEEIK